MQFEAELPRNVDAPGVARRLVADWFSRAVGDGAVATARLLVSEVVTNAVCHGRGRIVLRADLDDVRLRVEVDDEGVGFKRVVRERDESLGVGGWGLSFVDAESSRWGIQEGRAGVWFELERPRLRLAPPPNDPAARQLWH